MKIILNFIKRHARFLTSIIAGLLITILIDRPIVVDILVWSIIATINAIISVFLSEEDSFDRDISCAFGVICLILVSCFFIICTSEFKKSTEYYKPINVIRSYDRIILTGKTQILESNSLIIYNNKNPLICKDNKWDAFGTKMEDDWYVCIK